MRYVNRKNNTVGLNKSLEQYIAEFDKVTGTIGTSDVKSVIIPNGYTVSTETIEKWKAELKSALLNKAIVLKKVYKGNKRAYENSSNGVFLDGLIQINTELIEKYAPNEGAEICKYKTREVY